MFAKLSRLSKNPIAMIDEAHIFRTHRGDTICVTPGGDIFLLTQWGSWMPCGENFIAHLP